MRRIIIAAAALALIGSASLSAQTQTVKVQAAVQSVLVFTIDNGNGSTPQIFNFGNVDAAGTNLGNAPRVSAPVVNAVAGTATYNAIGAFNWAVRSAPRSTVTITSTASKSAGTTNVADSIGRTSMSLGQLQMRWLAIAPTVATTITSTFTSMTGGPQTWYVGPVGTGTAPAAPRANGTIDLSLTVDDFDLVEANEWTIVFTAVGT